MGRHKPSGSKAGGNSKVDRLADLRYLISNLDGIRAFRRMRTEKIENAFKRINAAPTWGAIKSDVERIVYLPNTIPGLLRLAKIAAILKMLFPTSIILVILALLIRMGIIPIDIPRALFVALLVFSPVVIVAFVLTDFTIRRKVIKYETEHPDLHSEEREHIKAVIQELITKLSKEIKSSGEDPSNYRMRLFYKDYERLVIIKECKEKALGIFKKQYSTYIATPS